MMAMALTRAAAGSLERVERDVPIALPGEILVRVLACGVCRTDLHIVDGELPPRELPVVPGHEVVGVVEVAGDGVERFAVGDRVGVPWLGYTCGECEACQVRRREEKPLRWAGATPVDILCMVLCASAAFIAIGVVLTILVISLYDHPKF